MIKIGSRLPFVLAMNTEIAVTRPVDNCDQFGRALHGHLAHLLTAAARRIAEALDRHAVQLVERHDTR